MTGETCFNASRILRMFYDLHEIRRRRISVPMSATPWKPDTLTAAGVASGGWVPPNIPDDPGGADADLTVSVWSYDDILPRTRFTIGHDDRTLQGMDSLDLYGDQAEPVLRGLLDGAYRIDRLEGAGADGCVILAAGGLPDLIADDEGGDHPDLAHSIMVYPVSGGERERPKRGLPCYDRDFRFRVQLTMNGVFVDDPPDGSQSLAEAVGTARMLGDPRHDVGPLPVPSDEDLLAEIPEVHGEEGWDRRITAAWRLDAFKGGPWDGDKPMVRAWVARVLSSYRSLSHVRDYTIIHEAGAGAYLDVAWHSDERWTINRRLSRSQLHALYPLLADGTRVVRHRHRAEL